MKKKLVILFFAFTILSPFACNKADRVNTPYSLLEGTWKQIAEAFDDNLNGVMDAAEVQTIASNTSELMKFNSDSTGNQHTVYNNVAADYSFTWDYQKSFTILQTVYNTHDTIDMHVDNLSLTDLTLKSYDSIYTTHSLIAHWKIYKKR